MALNPTPADNAWTASGLANVLPANFLDNMTVDLQPTKDSITKILNKIGLINILYAPDVPNPFGRFMGTTIPFGQYIENMAIGRTTAERFDPTNCSRKFVGTDIVSWYGEVNDEYIYPKAVSDTLIQSGVHDSVGLYRVINGILGSMRSWANNDQVTKFEKQFARISLDSTDEQGYTGGYETIGLGTEAAPVDDAQVAVAMVKKIIYYVNEFKGLRTEYNKLGIPMVSDVPPVVIISRQLRAQINFAIAEIYHTQPFDIPAEVIEVDSLATPAGNIGQIGALVIDPRVLLYHLRTVNVESERCSMGRFTLYSLYGKGAFNFLWGYNAVAIMLNEGADVAYKATPLNLPTGA